MSENFVTKDVASPSLNRYMVSKDTLETNMVLLHR